MTPRPALRALLAALSIAAGAAASPAAADPLPVALTLRDGRVAATVDLGPVLPADLAGRLGNGLRNVVAVYVAVVPPGGAPPVPAGARVFEVLFDVWEEAWWVTIREPQRPGGTRRVLQGEAEVRALLVRGADADLGPAATLPPLFTVDVRIDVNPVSDELLAHTREYLAGAAGRPGGASRSVLGAVAGFLLREPEDDGDVLYFRSRPLTPPGAASR